MNHDYAHCADYKIGICPRECFRGQLVRDLISTQWVYVSWMNLKGTDECMLKENTDGADNQKSNR